MVVKEEHSQQAICSKRKQTGSRCTLPCKSERTAFTLQYLQYLAEDRRGLNREEWKAMDYFEFFFIFAHTTRQKRESTWSKGGVRLWKKSEHKPNKKSEDPVSLFIWKAGLLTYSEVSYRNHNVLSIPLEKDGLIRQPTKKRSHSPIVFKNKRNSKVQQIPA